jgi:UDP-N-acetylglucosamine--N-acetylmuramyl-(pentapeptide) pyrophosphoryl-undecaprenol N-acetylglucosamine transferase
VLHVVGPQARPTRRRATAPYVVVPYVDRMDLAYAAADLVLCRPGANTVTEVAAVGLPGVFVPLPIGNGEQALNARPVVDAGGGLLVADAR